MKCSYKKMNVINASCIIPLSTTKTITGKVYVFSISSASTSNGGLELDKTTHLIVNRWT